MTSPKKISEALHFYRDTYRLSQAILTQLTGFSSQSMARWNRGKRPSQHEQKVIMELDHLLRCLVQVMEPTEIGRWIKQPNSAFDGSAPIQVLARGEGKRIWRMIHDLESGQPG